MVAGAESVCSPEAIEQWRDRRYRRRPELRVRTSEQALDWVNDVGLCFLFPDQRVEMPSLWEAICGQRRPLPVYHDDRELGYTWQWKDDLPSRGVVFYGKLWRKKPMLISLELLPHYYALSENYGDVDDYLIEYEEGRLSEEARRVYEALMERGAMPTSHLRRRAGLAGKEDAARFDRAIVELQLGLKIVKTGISDANAWKYCYVYDLLLRRWPDLAERAKVIATDEARRTLVLRHVHNVGVVSPRELVYLSGWEEEVVKRACSQLADGGALCANVRVEAWPGEYMAWPGLVRGDA